MTSMVSIVMPNYNGAETIDEAIASVVAQSYNDWELIVLDDGSADVSVFRVQQWLNLLPTKITLASWSLNSGSPVLPRNYGVKLAAGRYVAFLDSDDRWEREKLRKQVAYMEYSDAALTYHDVLLSEKIRGETRWSGLTRPCESWCFDRLLFKNFVPSSSAMVRAEVLKTVGGHDANFKISHDWDLWLRIARKYELGYIPEALGTLCVCRAGSVVSAVSKRRKESREVVRRWRGRVPLRLYLRCMAYYSMVEIWDRLLSDYGKVRFGGVG